MVKRGSDASAVAPPLISSHWFINGGGKNKAMEKYDVVIIGAGPAGMGAGVYAVRYNLKTLIIGKKLGGMMTEAHLVENYLGIPPTSGLELAQKFREMVEKLGIRMKIGDGVVSLKKTKEWFEVKTDKNETFLARSLIMAVGTTKRKLNIPGEQEFLGRGISYCFTCDGPMFRGKVVGVVGGANSAAMAALALAEHAKKVFVMYRRDRMRCEPVLLERIEKNPKIEVIYGVIPEKVEGERFLEYVMLKKSDKTKLKKVREGRLALQGLFVEIGEVPMAWLAKELGVKLSNGFIVVKNDMSTNVPGVFAAGDITTGSIEFRQIITSAAEGAVAAQSAFNYVRARN